MHGVFRLAHWGLGGQWYKNARVSHQMENESHQKEFSGLNAHEREVFALICLSVKPKNLTP